MTGISEGVVFAPQAPTQNAFMPNGQLRIVTTNPPTFQQCWHCVLTGAIEWRDVPLVTPEEAGIAVDEPVIVKGATV